jgi:hypothetical protein
LQGAALSVELNIGEGYTFDPSRSYTRHLSVAFGSAVGAGEFCGWQLNATPCQRESAVTSEPT